MSYTVMVADNARYMDDSEVHCAGEFKTSEDALQKCQSIVDEFLRGAYKQDMDADMLWESYVKWGSDPYIISDQSDPACKFSAWDYAKLRCSELCDKSGAF